MSSSAPKLRNTTLTNILTQGRAFASLRLKKGIGLTADTLLMGYAARPVHSRSNIANLIDFWGLAGGNADLGGFKNATFMPG